YSLSTHPTTPDIYTLSLHDALPIFCVSGSHAYAEEGNYAPSIQVSDIGGSQLALTSASSNIVSVAVADAPLTAQGKFLAVLRGTDRKSTRLNSSHVSISYAVFCLKK